MTFLACDEQGMFPLDQRSLDLLPAAVCVCHADGVIRYYNRRAAELWGRSPPPGDANERFNGALRLFHIDGRSMSHTSSPMAETLRTGLPQHGWELIVERPDGTRVIVLVSSDPLHDANGKLLGGISVFQDITARERASGKRKDEFLATLAHELRNPLAPIRNALHIMQLSQGKGDTIQQVRELMNRQIDHLVRLIDDLMDVSRMIQGKIDLRSEPLELATVLHRAIEVAQPVIESQSHELVVSIPSEPIWLYGDLVRLAQVINNLLTNAAKYTEKGGKICVTARQEGNQAVVYIRDSGIGIPREMLSRIFDKFVQISGDSSLQTKEGHTTSFSRAQGGLGLGLTLVKNLTELHGGNVEARSEGPGKGSEFIIRLPAINLSEAPPKPPPVQPIQVSGPARRVLVVDDNIDSANTLAVLLRHWGHQVQIAHDGIQAVQLATAYRPDVMLLDIGLPGFDGYEVARQLRNQGSNRPLLVAMTGYGQPSDRRRARDAGFDHHLVKPVDITEVQRLLATAPLPVA